MLFADLSESFGNFILTFLCIVAFIGGLAKRIDKGGAVKGAVGRGVLGMAKKPLKR